MMPWSPRHNHLRFALEQDAGRAIVRLAGELDCASAAIAHLALERVDADLTEIVLDLSRVVFLDAAGVRFLISAQRRARAAQRVLIVRRPSRSVRRMLQLTGVRPLLAIEGNDDRRPDDPATPELARILEPAIELAMRIAHADGSIAQLLDTTTGELLTVAQQGLSSTFLDYLGTVNDRESICGTALRAGRAVWVPDVVRSSILADTPARDVLLDAGVRAVACVLVKSDGEPIAMLSLHHRSPIEWTAEQKIELEQLGRSVAQQCLDALRLSSPVAGAGAI